MSNSEARALPYFTDVLGRPLESGKIYIGQAGLDPIANPQNVYSDAANTVLLAQPIRTLHGHAISGGAHVHMYCNTPYSITVMDESGRVNFTSLNESDTTASATGKTVPQTVDSLADLRARSSASTDQVVVTNYGIYVYDPTDTTSPESIPRVIVANDASRYKLMPEYLAALWAQVTGAGSPIVSGAHLSYNDDGTGSAVLTCNRGTLAGGIVLRTVSADGATEMGRIKIDAAGNLTTSSVTANGTLSAAGSITSIGGNFNLGSSGGRYLGYDGTNYVLPANNLIVNGSIAMTPFLQTTQAVGALNLNNGTPPTTGTWANISTVSGITLSVRVA